MKTIDLTMDQQRQRPLLGERIQVRAVRILLGAVMLACALAAAPLQAATEYVAYVTVTNIPAGLPTNIVVNIGAATTRNWTNDPTGAPTTGIRTTNTIVASVTNAVLHFSSYPIYSAGAGTPQAVVDYTSTNTAVFSITAPLNTNITVTFGGNWARVVYVTNTYADAYPILSPTNQMSPRVRTNAVNALVNLFAATNMVPSNAVPPGAKFLQHYTDNTSTQTISNKTLTAPVISGGIVSNVAAIRGVATALTNGIWTNATLLAPQMTNGANYGDAFRSPGASANSDQFGSGASVGAFDYAFAAGTFATVTAEGGTAIGNNAQAGYYATAEGGSAIASGGFSTALGASANATKTNSTSIGAGSLAGHTNSTAIGRGASTTTANQVRIGTSAETISIPGALEAAIDRNLTAIGTNTITGILAFDGELTVTTVANGHNVIDSSTNTVMYITGSPSAAWTLGGFSGAKNDGRVLTVINQTGYDITVQNESGTAPTASDRILTYAGASGVTNVVVTGNGVMTFIYSAAASRWILTSPTVDFTTFASLTTTAGGSTSNATVGGLLYKAVISPAFTNLNTTIATYTNASQYILPAHAMTNTGDSTIHIWRGKLLAGTNALRLVCGYQTVLDTGSFTNTDTAFEAGYELTRTGTVGSHVDAWVRLVQSVGALTSITGGLISTNAELTTTNGTAFTNLLRVASNRAGAVSNNYHRVFWEPASR